MEAVERQFLDPGLNGMLRPVIRPFPTDPEERAKVRADTIEEHTLWGARTGLRAGLSLRCGSGDHGCRNDGTGCLCLCHDR